VTTEPFDDVEAYLGRVATTAAAGAWDDLQPRGLLVTVQSGEMKVSRAMLAAGEFATIVSEDVFDPEIGGAARGAFLPRTYEGLLERSPDQLAFLIDPTSRPGTTPCPVPAGTDFEWHALAIPAPPSVDPEAWCEYGFPRAARTLVLFRRGSALGYGCLIPFHDHVLEAAIYVEEPDRGSGVGKAVASALFEDLSARGRWCHWVTLAQNGASQRLARLRRIVWEAAITTYVWT
jgi:hypothetical protein